MSILTLIVVVVLIFLAIWAIQQLASAFSIPPPIVTVLNVLIVVLAVLWLLSGVGLLTTPVLRVR